MVQLSRTCKLHMDRKKPSIGSHRSDLPSDADHGMSVHPGPSFLELVHHAPLLLQQLKAMGVLKPLRATCRGTNVLATSQITHLTIDLEQAASVARLQKVQPLLRGCRLQHLHIVLHLKQHDQLGKDLATISAQLGASLSNVTCLSIELRNMVPLVAGVQAGSRCPRLGSLAVTTLQALAPHCSPLTHLNIYGCLYKRDTNSAGDAPPDFGILDLLHTASSLTHRTLTHFSVAVEWLTWKEDPSNSTPAVKLFHWLPLSQSCLQALQAFTRLTHLQLPGGITTEDVQWGLLPPLLQVLSLHAVGSGPAEGVALPSLHSLSLSQCGCSSLTQFLRASNSTLRKLQLCQLDIAGDRQSLADLHAIYRHPLLALDSNSSSSSQHNLLPCYNKETQQNSHQGRGPGRVASATPSITICRHGSQYPHFSPWDILPLLPVMPAVLACSVESSPLLLHDGALHEAEVGFEWQEADPCLQHLHRACPGLRTLVLQHVQLADAELIKLQPCSVLENLQLVDCRQVSGQGLLSLLQTMPGLLSVELVRCDSVDSAAVEILSMLRQSRVGSRAA